SSGWLVGRTPIPAGYAAFLNPPRTPLSTVTRSASERSSIFIQGAIEQAFPRTAPGSELRLPLFYLRRPVLQDLTVPLRSRNLLGGAAQVLPQGFHGSQFLGDRHFFDGWIHSLVPECQGIMASIASSMGSARGLASYGAGERWEAGPPADFAFGRPPCAGSVNAPIGQGAGLPRVPRPGRRAPADRRARPVGGRPSGRFRARLLQGAVTAIPRPSADNRPACGPAPHAADWLRYNGRSATAPPPAAMLGHGTPAATPHTPDAWT
ncbi:hypothetical protein D893_02732, partial [Thioalkalivibrio sp. ALE21]